MNQAARFGLWIDRIVLAATTVILMAISARFVIDPISAASARGIVINSAIAAMTARIGFGAFPLALAVFTLSCLVSRTRHRIGVALVAILMAVLIVIRFLSLITDGAVPESVRLFAPEGIILVLALTGLLVGGSRPTGETA